MDVRTWWPALASLTIKIVVLVYQIVTKAGHSEPRILHFNYSVSGLVSGQPGPSSGPAELQAEFSLEFVPNISNSCPTSRALNLPPVWEINCLSAAANGDSAPVPATNRSPERESSDQYEAGGNCIHQSGGEHMSGRSP